MSNSPVCLLDELYAFLPISQSTSRRPSLLGQCTSFHLSTDRREFLLFSPCTIVGPIAYLRRHKKDVNTILLMVRYTSSSASSVPYIRCIGPFPHHDQAAPLTTHTHPTCLKLPTESHLWLRGSGNLRRECHTFCAFPFATSNGLSSSDLRSEGLT